MKTKRQVKTPKKQTQRIPPEMFGPTLLPPEQTKRRILTGEVEDPALVVALRMLTDHQRLWGAGTLKEFLAVLQDISPYWQEGAGQCESYAAVTLRLVRAQIVYHRELSPMDLPSAPNDWIGVDDWVVSVKKLLKRKPKKDTLSAEAKLAGVLTLSVKGGKRRSIAWIANEAGVSRRTAHASPQFMSLYRSIYPKKSRKKGSKYRFDEDRNS